MTSSPYNLPIEQACHEPSFLKEKIRSSVPPHILDSYPNFFNFLKAYFEYLDEDDNILEKIKRLRSARDPVMSEYKTSLIKEFGENFPTVTAIDQGLLLKILKMFYLSKGNEESIKAYFKLFLNDPNARVVYPKENMLRCDDGEWDDANGVYTSFQGQLDEAFMVLQDDLYYQIYSYVIKSGQSVVDWGPAFEQAVHPVGWKYFGEVEIVSLARFRTGLLSPLIVPGSQSSSDPALILTSAAICDEDGIMQQLYRIMNPLAEFTYNSLSLGYNILGTQGLTVSDLAAFTIEELTTTAIDTDIRRGATIIIT